jgi:rhodanese-related sulfurtransferase
MEPQLFFYVIGGLLILVYVRKALQSRSLKQYNASEVDTLVTSRNALLLDVRSDAERRRGTIKGSVHIPLPALRSRMNELEKHKSKEIVCFCQSGSRSTSAALLLNKNGYTAANLRGGMAEWKFAHR